MAKKAYVGISNVAQQSKKIYVGVSGVARKVKKGYIGVNGVARLFFQSDLKLVYYKNYYSTTGRYPNTCSGYNGKYGFIGGSSTNNHTTDILAIDKSFTITTPTVLNARPSDSAQLEQYVFFAPSSSSGSIPFDYYNQSQTHSSVSVTTTNNRTYALLYNDNYVVMFPTENSGYSGTLVYLLNASLTVSSVSVSGTFHHGGMYCTTTNGVYGMLYGGRDGSYSSSGYNYFSVNYCEAVDTSGTVTKVTDMSELYGSLGVRAGDYALIIGGEYQNTATNRNYDSYEVYAFDQSLTKTSAPSISMPVNTWVWSQKSAASAGEYGIASTMRSLQSGYSQKYEAYNKSLTQQVFATEDKIRYAGVTVTEGAVFASSYTTGWDAFKLE